MLDTNAVSYLVKKDAVMMQRVQAVPISALCISAITHGELLFGLAKRPEATRLHAAVRAFLRCVDVMPWNETVSEHYAHIRATLVRQGKTLAPLDLLIAAHAISIGAVLVTNDQAFRLLDSLRLEDWTEAVS
jgi:tRNA(fMet)-specific endonuclease VapC